jgi:hypothetical protein
MLIVSDLEICQNLCSDVSDVLKNETNQKHDASVSTFSKRKVLSVTAYDSQFSRYVRLKLILSVGQDILHLCRCFSNLPHSESVDVSHDVWPEEVLIFCYKEAGDRWADTQSYPSSGIKCTLWSSLWYCWLVSRINERVFITVTNGDTVRCGTVHDKPLELPRGRVNPVRVSTLSTVTLLFFSVMAFTEQSKLLNVVKLTGIL